jgi:hypothetical protein
LLRRCGSTGIAISLDWVDGVIGVGDLGKEMRSFVESQVVA